MESYEFLGKHHHRRSRFVLERGHVLPGDMDLDPVSGQYRLMASVPGVEMNDLRRTLGIKPPPMPIGGALRGVLHCTGPLEQPVFSGPPPTTL